MPTTKCPYCSFENVMGSDHCGKCLHSFMQKDVPQPNKEKLQQLILTEAVSDFVSKATPLVVSPKTSLKEVIELMQANPTKGCVLVCEPADRLIGILSIRDILLRVAGHVTEKDLATYPVEKMMTKKPESLPCDAPLQFAINMMSIGKFRHVPVVEQGRPIGVVSTRDLVEYLSTHRKKKNSK